MSEHLICVVDDDDSVREAVRGLLRSAGYTVESFASAGEFLAASVRPRAECLVLDVSMPAITGPELQARLVAEHAGPLPLPLPMIFMSAGSDESARARVLAAGAFAFLRKPFDDEELLTVVHEALEGKIPPSAAVSAAGRS